MKASDLEAGSAAKLIQHLESEGNASLFWRVLGLVSSALGMVGITAEVIRFLQPTAELTQNSTALFSFPLMLLLGLLFIQKSKRIELFRLAKPVLFDALRNAEKSET